MVPAVRSANVRGPACVSRRGGNAQIAVVLAMAIVATLSGIVTATAYLFTLKAEHQARREHPTETPSRPHTDPRPEPAVEAADPFAVPPTDPHDSTHQDPAVPPVPPSAGAHAGHDHGSDDPCPHGVGPVKLDPTATRRVADHGHGGTGRGDPGSARDAAGTLDVDQIVALQRDWALRHGETAPTVPLPENLDPTMPPAQVDPPAPAMPALETIDGRGFGRDEFASVDVVEAWAGFQGRYGGTIFKFGDTGNPAGIADFRTEPYGSGAGGDPVAAARAFLAAHKNLLRVDPDNLQAVQVGDVAEGRLVRFAQVYRGMPVLHPGEGEPLAVLVTVDGQGRAVRYASDYAPITGLSVTPQVDATQVLGDVLDSARRQFPGDSFQVESQDLVVLATWDEDRVTGSLTWRILLSSAQGFFFQSLVDATTGAVYGDRWWEQEQE